jgi:hypothetical protein
MRVIVVFWQNADNFAGVIVRNESMTVEEQVKQWELVHQRIDGHYGIEFDADEQEAE